MFKHIIPIVTGTLACSFCGIESEGMQTHRAECPMMKQFKNQKPVKCYKCGGTGTIRKEKFSSTYSWISYNEGYPVYKMYHKCPVCGGEGTIILYRGEFEYKKRKPTEEEKDRESNRLSNYLKNLVVVR